MSVKIQKNNGFTIAEVIVTTVIVGVLASFAVPSFSSSIESMKAREADQILSAIKMAVDNYSLDRGGCSGPLSLSDLGLGAVDPKYFDSSTLLIDCNAVSMERNNGSYVLTMPIVRNISSGNISSDIFCTAGSKDNLCSKLSYSSIFSDDDQEKDEED